MTIPTEPQTIAITLLMLGLLAVMAVVMIAGFLRVRRAHLEMERHHADD